MVFPDSVRVHQIVDYYYCSERSRLMTCLGLQAPHNETMDKGCNVHQWLTQRPKTASELKLFELLKPYEPFSRVFNNVKIIGHPDDLTVLGKNKVQIVEYKTIDKPTVKPWKTVLAKHQTQLYAWILEPIVQGLDYELAYTHKIVYLARNGLFIKRLTVEHDSCCTERLVREVFGFWKSGEPLIKPLKWKCKQCSTVFQSQCRIVKGEKV